MLITINTIGDLIDHGFRLTAFCDELECRHTKVMDLDALADQLGRDFAFVGKIQARLSCSRCGGRNVSVIVHPLGAELMGQQHAGH